MASIQPGSHLDHLLKQTRVHHMHLSTMADMKANILLTMSSVVFTFSLDLLSDPLLGRAVLVLQFFCVITIFLAAFVVMPHISFSTKPGPHQDVNDRRFNILFFGSFTALSYDEYMDEMNHVLSDIEHAYEVQVREIYQLGVFLARKKYRFLRWAYVSFLVGFVAAGLVALTQAFYG
ncbi:Pycsar system effector family protein [Acanthopleuribacter pedis]|uniref:Pycsar effector protein domain-containing protein n=1 Tax=Acanthopleuribacter pedis TaxID=442870 RepID=A0A8J7U5K1_9BACT|nr:hypothetical protein [Acanthopleuribacter pedis]